MEDDNSQLQTKPAASGSPDWLLWKMKGRIDDLEHRVQAQEDTTSLDCSFVFSVEQPQKGRIFVPVGSTCGYDDSVAESDVVCTATQGPSDNPQSATSDITPFELQPASSGSNYMVEIVASSDQYNFEPPDEWHIACRASTTQALGPK